MDTLRIGQTGCVKRVFSQEDMISFAMLSGDDNPIHIDPVFSARTKFGKMVTPGILLYSAISAAIAKWLPGEGFMQISQELIFPSPTFVDEMVEIRLQVTAFPTTETVEITTEVLRPNGKFGCTGNTHILYTDANLRILDSDRKPTGYENDAREHRGLSVGQHASRTSVFTGGSWGQVGNFLALVNDGNLLYWDPIYARERGFEDVILPGGLLGSMISDLLGTKLPGWGTNWLKQRFDFLKPAYPNSTITANVEIVRLRPEKDLVNLRTTCVDPVGELVLDGEALVLVNELEGERE